MKKSFFLFLTLALINMLVIFMFSSQVGKESSSISKGITTKIINTVNKIADSDKTVTEKDVTKEEENFVRKVAHVALYFSLGLFVYLAMITGRLTSSKLYDLLIALMICLLYAISDEVHQLFVKGRTGRVLDVVIDFAGSSVAVILCFLITESKRRKVN